MNFIKFLTEAMPVKPRGRMVNGKFVPDGQDQQDQSVAPDMNLFNKPRQKRQAKPDPMQAAQQAPPSNNPAIAPQPQNNQAAQKQARMKRPGVTTNSPGRSTARDQAPEQTNMDLKQMMVDEEFRDAAKANRQDAVSMITLLGSIYQARKRNPSVQLKDMPKMASSPLLQKLFTAAKDKQLPELAAMSNEIKQASTVDPNKGKETGNPAPNSAMQPAQPQQPAPQQGNLDLSQQAPAQQPAEAGSKAPEQQGATPAQQTQLQQLLDLINKSAPQLTSRQIKAASRALNQKGKNAAEPHNPKAPQQNSGQVINTG